MNYSIYRIIIRKHPKQFNLPYRQGLQRDRGCVTRAQTLYWHYGHIRERHLFRNHMIHHVPCPEPAQSIVDFFDRDVIPFIHHVDITIMKKTVHTGSSSIFFLLGLKCSLIGLIGKSFIHNRCNEKIAEKEIFSTKAVDFLYCRNNAHPLLNLKAKF